MSNLVLWGHGQDDYQEMFDINLNDIAGRVLEYSSGPSAFNTDLHKKGKDCVSADPLFSLDDATLKSKVSLIFADMAEKITNDHDKFDFSKIGGLTRLLEKRQAGMKKFFKDFDLGLTQQRYLPLQTRTLPFDDFYFDLALSSHYFFGQIDNLDLNLHLQILKELARVAKEVRIFPLIDRHGGPSPFLGPVLLALQQENFGTEVRSVDYSLQSQGNAMLRIWAQTCPLGTKKA